METVAVQNGLNHDESLRQILAIQHVPKINQKWIKSPTAEI